MRTINTKPEDIIKLDFDLSPEDRKEAHASNPGAQIVWDLLENLKRCQQRPSDMVMRSLYSPSGELLLVGGWTRMGHTWMLATNAAKRFPMETLRGIRECREMALKDCPRLYNICMKTNHMHVKLLTSIGAEFVGPITSMGGEPFQAFYIE